MQTSRKISTSCSASSTSRLWSFHYVRNNYLQSWDDGCVCFLALKVICCWLLQQVRCFECKAFGVLQDEMMQCTFEGCSKFYHVKCIKRLAQAITTTPITTAAVAAMTKTTTVAAVASSSLVCPHHHCHACVDSEDVKQEKLLRCLKCPISYHKPCAPDGTHLLEDMPGYLICRKHVDNWKHDSVVCHHPIFLLWFAGLKL